MSIAGSSPLLHQLETHSVIMLARAGDMAASCELIGRHERLARRTALAILKNREDAEDAIQEASLRMYQKIDSFQGDSAFTTWFVSIVINTCLMQLRRRKRRPLQSLDEILCDDGPVPSSFRHPGASAEQAYLAVELESKMRQAIHRLPSRLQSVAEDRFFDELSLRDLAARRGITITAAKSRVFRARKKIEAAIHRDRLVANSSQAISV